MKHLNCEVDTGVEVPSGFFQDSEKEFEAELGEQFDTFTR